MNKPSENLKKLEEMLRNRHAEILQEVERHGKIIHEAVPHDEEDASNLKEEIEIRTAADRMGVSELELIQDALDRIKNGQYGDCGDCGKAIPIERLQARPYSKLCVPCQEKAEKK